MVVIFIITQATHQLIFKHFKFPSFIWQIVTGILLGPSIKDKSGTSHSYRANEFKEFLFPLLSQDVIGTASVFGYSLFLFLTGVKMDIGMVKKTGHKALAIGISSLLLPLVCGLLTAAAYAYFTHDGEGHKVSFVAATSSLTSFAVVSSLLEDLKILNSELGRLGLSSALVCEMMNLIITSPSSIVRVYMRTEQPIFKIFRGIASLIGFVLGIMFIIRPAFFWIVRHTPAGWPVKNVYLYAIFLLVSLSGFVSDMLYQTALFGPFVLGLAIPVGPPLGSALVEKLDSFVSGIFLPLFVTISAMKVDLSPIAYNDKLLVWHINLLVVTFVSKVMACFVPS